MLKKKIKNIDWESISSDWEIFYRERGSSPQVIKILEPKRDCCKENPLYQHYNWLKYLYEELDLSYRQIAEISGVNHRVISYWAEKNGLTKKKNKGEWIDSYGYIRVYAPEGYYHPEIKPVKRGEGRFICFKHRLIMEDYLSKHPELEISKKCMIDGKYLSNKCPVHHIDYDKLNNDIENLCVFEKQSEHMLCQFTLKKCLSTLNKLGKIQFDKHKRKYFSDNNFDILDFSKAQIQDILAPRGEIYYKNIENVQKALKKVNWDIISTNWLVKRRQNQFSPYEYIQLYPNHDCSADNSLYMHKDWLEYVVNNEEFNMSDLRLGELCNITKDKARSWRRKLDVSRGRKWGFNRFINKNGRIWIRPKDYKNPIALKNQGYILEHRYIVEQHLNKNLNSTISKLALDNEGYLKSEFIIHHINLDPSDNRLDNLLIVFSESEHKTLEYSLHDFIKNLLKSNIIMFGDGKYKINF